MKISLSLLACTLSVLVYAQKYPGTSKSYMESLRSERSLGFQEATFSNDNNTLIFETTTYTFEDLIIFSYFDDTEIEISNSNGVVESVQLQDDQFHIFSSFGGGSFTVNGNKSFSLLTGDPVSAGVMGFYAVDQSGKPLSTRLNTYMPRQDYGPEKFIVFAYQDDTQFSILNIETNRVVSQGILDEGEHFTLESNYNSFLGVRSSKPVSALSYTDQGYYIPAANGTFAGNVFYGFSGNLGAPWPNGIVITSYEDNNSFVLIDSDTKDTLDRGVLQIGEVFNRSTFSDQYWEVFTDKKVTISNTPYSFYNSNYFYLTRQMDESGRGMGTNFYLPLVGGDLDVLSFEDDNSFSIIDVATGDTLLRNYELNKGERFFTRNSKAIFQLVSDKNVSVISSNGGSFGADFVPLNFATSFTDLAIAADDITFSPDTLETIGEPFDIHVSLSNASDVGAGSFLVHLYDGVPEGGRLIDSIPIDTLQSQKDTSVVFSWIVPDNPQYHQLYAWIDPLDSIIESNSSNNITSKFLVANDDLRPPLVSNVRAPGNLRYEGNVLMDSVFDIFLDVFNDSQVTALSASAVISLPDGFKVNTAVNNPDSVFLGDIVVGNGVNVEWSIEVSDTLQQGVYFYEVRVMAENADTKILERLIILGQPGFKLDQVLEVQDIPDLTLNTPFSISATSNSENPIHIVVNDGDFSIDGLDITPVVGGMSSVSIYQSETKEHFASDTITMLFCVNPIRPEIRYQGSSVSGDLEITDRDNRSFRALVGLGQVTWYHNDQEFASTAEVSFESGGTYRVTESIEGCIAESESVNVNIVLVASLGSESQASIIYPNPVSDRAIIVTEYDNKLETIEILSANGHRLLEMEAVFIENVGYTFDVSGLSTGIYFVRFSNSQRSAYRFIKKD